MTGPTKSLTVLRGGSVYDPLRGVAGATEDLWIQDGLFVDPAQVLSSTDPLQIQEVDVRGLVLMPGGIDIHAHIAGPKVNIARKLRPEDRRAHAWPQRPQMRSGTVGSTPTTFVTGYLYTGLGYTTVFDAAIPPLGARHTHEEFHDTPVIDKGFFVLVGNHHFVLDCLAQKEPVLLRNYLAYLLNATKGYALKIVNPGGVEAWKQGRPGLSSFEDLVPHFEVSPREILQGITQAANELGLPHPVHVHCNDLGMPGNWETTLASFQAVEGLRAHFTHIQFHSYTGTRDDTTTMGSAVPQLAEYVNQHPNLTVDVGQVLFGETTSMTGDGPLGYFLHRVTGRKWFNSDTECEGGCGIVPMTYKEKSVVHALQWAIGLEWFLLVRNPWQIAMSTDHPNGGAFVAYPEIIALLMSRDYRREVLSQLPPAVLKRTTLADLDREYTLDEIAIVTRAAPARMLGLTQKGHLGPGADADLTVYLPQQDRRAMFALPKYVYKSGRRVVENGEIRLSHFGPVYHVAPEFDDGILPRVRSWFETNYSLDWRNYALREHELTHGAVNVACQKR